MTDPRSRATIRTAAICGAVVVGMTGAAFAAVPLYRAFCQITGFDGATRRADAPSKTVLDRTVTVRFDANTRDLPWTFRTEQVRQEVKIGATNMAYYKVTNTGDRPTTGMATYNVVPESAGPHFRKLQCFCFEAQTIQPGETVEFPVIYFVDPELASDPETRRVDEVTLSYTFFPTEPAKTVQVPPTKRAEAG
jgi:cytochrome c oxidase assembly protein subunit 11